MKAQNGAAATFLTSLDSALVNADYVSVSNSTTIIIYQLDTDDYTYRVGIKIEQDSKVTNFVISAQKIKV